jgi:nitrous oxidase accessory protein NosD
MGADAAGFLIVYNSCGNTFRRNNARLGGDGFFLAGLAPKGERAGCNDNIFEENDGSYSPNIAFEATFSRGNIYRHNKANDCNYGFWLGFSRDFVLAENQVWRNRQAGIAVENGFNMVAQGNDFRFNRHGVLLWSKHVALFARAVPENDTSRDWLIEENTFVHNDKAIRIAANQDHGIRPLPSVTPSTIQPHSHIIRRNEIRDGRLGIELENVDDTVVEDNRIDL